MAGHRVATRWSTPRVRTRQRLPWSEEPAPSVTVTQPRRKPWVGRVHIRSCRNPVSKALRKGSRPTRSSRWDTKLISAVKTKVQDAPGG